MIKNIKHGFVLIFIGFFTLAGFASEEKERAHPVVIRIIPQTRDFIQTWNPSESVPPKDVGFEDDLRYLDEYGYKAFFVYHVDAIHNFMPAAPVPQEPSPDYAILEGLAEYRKTHLNNSNPMIVRVRVHDDKGGVFPTTISDNDCR